MRLWLLTYVCEGVARIRIRICILIHIRMAHKLLSNKQSARTRRSEGPRTPGADLRARAPAQADDRFHPGPRSGCD